MATTAAPKGAIWKQMNEHPNFNGVAHVGIAYTGTIISYTHDGNKCIHDDIVGMHVAVERVCIMAS